MNNKKSSVLTMNKKWYRLLFEKCNEAAFVFNYPVEKEGAGFVQVNEAACNKLSYTKEELLRLSLSDVIRRRGKSAEDMIQERLRYDDHLTFESVLITRYNGEISVENSCHRFVYNKEKFVFMISHDISERKRDEADIKHRMEFESIITNLSTRFINIPASLADKEINHALKVIGKFVDIDRSYLFQFSKDRKTADNTHEWCAAGINPQMSKLQGVPVGMAPWWMGKLHRREDIEILNVADLPAVANAEKELLQAQDIQSLVAVPVIYSAELIGFLGFDSVRRRRIWTIDEIRLLRIVGEMFANLLQRRKTEELLKVAHDELDKLVIERTAELTQTNEKLQQEITKRQKIEDALYESKEKLKNYRDDLEHTD